MTSKTVDERYSEIEAKFRKALSERWELDPREEEFCENMLELLHRYRERTYITAKQLNWLSAIEDKIDMGLNYK